MILLAMVMMASAPAAATDDFTYRATAPDAAAQLAALLDLYGTLCLRAFPDDAAVATAVVARGGQPMSAAGVRHLLHDDPGSGWVVVAAGARFNVTIEQPPYHGCAVRTMTVAGLDDARAYRALLDGYERDRGAFATLAPISLERDGVSTVLQGEGARNADGGAEMLMRGEAHVTDPAVRASGQTAVEVRYVHDIVTPVDPRSR